MAAKDVSNSWECGKLIIIGVIPLRKRHVCISGASKVHLGRLGPSDMQGRCCQLPTLHICSTGQHIETSVFQLLCKTHLRYRVDSIFSKSPRSHRVRSNLRNLTPLSQRRLVPHKVLHIPLCPPHCLNILIWAGHRLQLYRLPPSPAQMRILLVLPTQLPRTAPLMTQS